MPGRRNHALLVLAVGACAAPAPRVQPPLAQAPHAPPPAAAAPPKAAEPTAGRDAGGTEIACRTETRLKRNGPVAWEYVYRVDRESRLVLREELVDGDVTRRTRFPRDNQGRIVALCSVLVLGDDVEKPDGCGRLRYRGSDARPFEGDAVTNDGTVVARYDYRYDAQGRLLERRTTLTSGSGYVQTRHYAADGRLEWEEQHEAGTPTAVTRFRYTPSGELMEERVEPHGVVQTWVKPCPAKILGQLP
jgi:YD repeat-containing protein